MVTRGRSTPFPHAYRGNRPTFELRVFHRTQAALGIAGRHGAAGHLQNTPRALEVRPPLGGAGPRSGLYPHPQRLAQGAAAGPAWLAPPAFRGPCGNEPRALRPPGCPGTVCLLSPMAPLAQTAPRGLAVCRSTHDCLLVPGQIDVLVIGNEKLCISQLFGPTSLTHFCRSTVLSQQPC